MDTPAKAEREETLLDTSITVVFYDEQTEAQFFTDQMWQVPRIGDRIRLRTPDDGLIVGKVVNATWDLDYTTEDSMPTVGIGIRVIEREPPTQGVSQ